MKYLLTFAAISSLLVGSSVALAQVPPRLPRSFCRFHHRRQNTPRKRRNIPRNMIQGTMTGARTGIHLIGPLTIPSGLLGGGAGNVIPHLIETLMRMAPESCAIRPMPHQAVEGDATCIPAR